jgi:hypothetical protein
VRRVRLVARRILFGRERGTVARTHERDPPMQHVDHVADDVQPRVGGHGRRLRPRARDRATA